MNTELHSLLINAGKTDVASAQQYLLNALKLLQQNNLLTLGDDKDLANLSLELRVKQLFHEKGFNISDGRPGQEDFVVLSEDTDNLVIEVKSSRHPSSKLVDLRQLDDWVFDLSGEENARKNGLGGV